MKKKKKPWAAPSGDPGPSNAAAVDEDAEEDYMQMSDDCCGGTAPQLPMQHQSAQEANAMAVSS